MKAGHSYALNPLLLSDEEARELAKQIPSQKSLIYNTSKDIAILDACQPQRLYRFSRLEGITKQFKLVLSEGTNTHEWFRRTFTEPIDCIYISANPYISSKGMHRKSVKGMRIIDAWEFLWNEEHKTVLPWTLYSYYRAIRPLTKKRIFIHFIQPHFPPIDSKYDLWEDARRENLGLKKQGKKYPTMREAAQILGREAVIKMHEKNLIAVLSCLQNFDGIITSDHGEFLGERNQYSHVNKDFRLRFVGWLE